MCCSVANALKQMCELKTLSRASTFIFLQLFFVSPVVVVVVFIVLFCCCSSLPFHLCLLSAPSSFLSFVFTSLTMFSFFCYIGSMATMCVDIAHPPPNVEPQTVRLAEIWSLYYTHPRTEHTRTRTYTYGHNLFCVFFFLFFSFAFWSCVHTKPLLIITVRRCRRRRRRSRRRCHLITWRIGRSAEKQNANFQIRCFHNEFIYSNSNIIINSVYCSVWTRFTHKTRWEKSGRERERSKRGGQRERERENIR